MRPSVPDVHITDSRDEELSRYRPVSARAVVAMILGLAAPAAFLSPTLWAVPIVGVLLGASALRRIRRSEPAMAGRSLALIGVTLSLLMATAAPTDWFVYRWRVRNEATELATQWLRYLTEDEPQKAFQLTLPVARRQPLDDQLWAVYRNNPKLRQQLESYVTSDVVRTMLALGSKANVRFYETSNQTEIGSQDIVSQLFAVTYEEAGERKTFFVAVDSVRTKPRKRPAEWRIHQATGGVKLEGW